MLKHLKDVKFISKHVKFISKHVKFISKHSPKVFREDCTSLLGKIM